MATARIAGALGEFDGLIGVNSGRLDRIYSAQCSQHLLAPLLQGIRIVIILTVHTPPIPPNNFMVKDILCLCLTVMRETFRGVQDTDWKEIMDGGMKHSLARTRNPIWIRANTGAEYLVRCPACSGDGFLVGATHFKYASPSEVEKHKSSNAT